MSSLRLKATGERLIWKNDEEFDEISLCRESVDVSAWFATISSVNCGVYSSDESLGGSRLWATWDVSGGVEYLRRVCEDALVNAGVAEIIDEEPFPSD